MRVRCEVPIVWKRGARRVEARIRDVNVDGMFIETPVPIPSNQVMDLEVQLPSGPISVIAVSKGASELGLGIGVSIFAMDPVERYRWNAHYRATLEHEVSKLPETVACLIKIPA